ncbi:MAG: hypothetical protein WDN75_16390 [Bacteroidota bacterium]
MEWISNREGKRISVLVKQKIAFENSPSEKDVKSESIDELYKEWHQNMLGLNNVTNGIEELIIEVAKSNNPFIVENAYIAGLSLSDVDLTDGGSRIVY